MYVDVVLYQFGVLVKSWAIGYFLYYSHYITYFLCIWTSLNDALSLQHVHMKLLYRGIV